MDYIYLDTDKTNDNGSELFISLGFTHDNVNHETLIRMDSDEIFHTIEEYNIEGGISNMDSSIYLKITKCEEKDENGDWYNDSAVNVTDECNYSARLIEGIVLEEVERIKPKEYKFKLKISELNYGDYIYLFDLSKLKISSDVETILDNMNGDAGITEEEFNQVVEMLEEQTEFKLPKSMYGWVIGWNKITQEF